MNFKTFRNKYNSEVIFFLKSQLGRTTKELYFGFIFLILSVLSLIPMPVLTKNLFDSFAKGMGTTRLTTFCFIFLLALVCRESFSYISQYCFEKTTISLTKNLTLSIFSIIQNIKERFHEDHGCLLTRISNDTEELSNFIVPVTPKCIKDIITFLTASIIGCFISLPLTMIALFPLLFFVGTRQIINPHIREISMLTHLSHSHFIAKISEAIRHMPLFRVYLKEKKNIERIHKAAGEFFNNDLKRKKTIVALNFPLSLIFSAGYVISILFGAYFLSIGSISNGELIGFLLVLQYIYDPFPRFLQFSTTMQEIKPVVSRLSEILTIYKRKQRSHLLKTLTELKELTLCIDKFKYSTSSEVVLKNVQFSLKKGECLGILGKSGAGKTTLINILLGLCQTNSVKINNVSLSLFSLESVWKRISYFSQESPVFSGTLQANLFIESFLTLNEIFHAFLSDIGDLKTIDENGKNLSLGQRQRIGIVRALIKDSDLFIFDEPIAHLDQKRINEFVLFIKEVLKNKAIIIISHQFNILDVCQRHIIINE